MRLTVFALFVLAAAAASDVAQESGINGTWRGTAEATSRRNADGSVDILSSRPFELVTATEGDRVKGTWSEASFKWEITGTWRGGVLNLTTAWQEAPEGDGPQRFRWVLSGARREDRLEGTRYLEVEGRQREPVLLKWTAERR